MELVFKCAALAVFASLMILMVRRVNPELSFALGAAATAILLLAGGGVLNELLRAFRDTQQIFGSSTVEARSILKCLGIAMVSRFSADLCRDASQSALAAALETIGTLCAAAVTMPMILSLMTTIGGML